MRHDIATTHPNLRDVVVVLALLALPSVLSAQQHPHGAGAPDSVMHDQSAPCAAAQMMSGDMRMGMMSGMMQEQGMMHMAGGELMHRTMQLQPGHVLDDREKLELAAEQVSKLEQLETARRAAHQQAMATARAGWEKVREAFDGSDADPDAVRMAAAEAFGAQVSMHVQMITDAATVQGILTEAQREKLVQGPCGMHMRMQDGMGPGGHGGSPDDQ